MKAFTLRLLRRLSVLALGVAIALAVGPAALRWLGLVGPSLDQDLESVARALEVARSYGGGPGQDAFRSAADTLAQARELARRGERRGARRRAAVALEQARQAQRAALVGRDQERRRAQAIVNELDAGLNRLEGLYSETAARADAATTARLLSQMKDTRETSAGLFLAFESGAYAKVLAGEARALEAIAGMRGALEAARAGSGPAAAPRR